MATGSKKKKKRTKRIISSIIAVIIVVVLLRSVLLTPSGETGMLENGIAAVFTPVESLFSGIGGFFKSLFGVSGNGSLDDQLAELKRQNELLKIELNSFEEIEHENERLQDLLDAESNYSELEPVYAKVIAKDTGVWFNTFTINKGTNDKINVNMAVVNADGLVGRISKVGLNYAIVTTIIDSGSSVAAIISRTRDNGMLKGFSNGNSSDVDLRMYYISNMGSIKIGDSVYTSGLDSRFPKGVYIGTVASVSRSATSSDKYLSVQPAVNFSSVEDVFVLRIEIEEQYDALPNVPTPTPIPIVTPAPTSTVGIYSYATQSPVDDDAIFHMPTPTPDPNVTPAPTPTPAPAKPVPEAAWMND